MKSEIIYYVLFLISFILLFFAVRSYQKTQNLLVVGIKTKAEVISMEVTSGSDSDTYSPVFEYINNAQETKTFSSEVSSSSPSYRIGDVVSIIYDPKTYTAKVISYWGLYRWTIILSAIALPITLISIGYFLYSRS